ncbi:MAG: DNA replication/repair protein RecF [Bacteroidota bacterium]
MPESVHFEQLQLTQFRNYSHAQLDLQPGVTCFCGPNGAGKTNLLEAIRVLALTRGFHSERDLVQHNTNYFALKARWQGPDRQHTIVLSYDKQQGKKLLVDRQAEKRLSDHIGRIPLVALLPDDTVVIKQGGLIRRQWLDLLISQSDKAYLAALIQYEKALSQRNALLKQLSDGSIPSPSVLEPWDHQLAHSAPQIIRTRRAFLADFQPEFNTQHQFIVEADSPQIVYKPSIDTEHPSDVIAALSAQRTHDLRSGHSTLGPHRDRLQLLLDGHPIRHFGSQGQQKTFLAALKLAQAKRLFELSGRPPVLLLDDMYDKLDDDRMARISERLTAGFIGQVFITDTSLSRLQNNLSNVQTNVSYFRVLQGDVSPAEIA